MHDDIEKSKKLPESRNRLVFVGIGIGATLSSMPILSFILVLYIDSKLLSKLMKYRVYPYISSLISTNYIVILLYQDFNIICFRSYFCLRLFTLFFTLIQYLFKYMMLMMKEVTKI